MKTLDYDQALLFLYQLDWDSLMTLKANTDDDLLAKRIEILLQAYFSEKNYSHLEQDYFALLNYLDHALQL